MAQELLKIFFSRSPETESYPETDLLRQNSPCNGLSFARQEVFMVRGMRVISGCRGEADTLFRRYVRVNVAKVISIGCIKVN